MVHGKIEILQKSNKKAYKDGGYLWLCKCFCNDFFLTRRHSVLDGSVRSCGCIKKELLKVAATTHGHSYNKKTSKTYHSWRSMNARCKNTNLREYKDYGGRGISVCKEWMKFENFLKDMGNAPEGMSIDRIDNNAGYFKENCKWSTPKEQQGNTRSTVGVLFDGTWKSLVEVAEIINIKRDVLYKREKRKGTLIYKYPKISQRMS